MSRSRSASNFRCEPSAKCGPTARPSHFSDKTPPGPASEGEASVAAVAKSSQGAACLAVGWQAIDDAEAGPGLEAQTDRSARAGPRCRPTATGRNSPFDPSGSRHLSRFGAASCRQVT